MRIIKLSLVIAAAATILYTAFMKITWFKHDTTYNAHYILRVIPGINSGVRNIGVDVDNVTKVILTRIMNYGYKGSIHKINNNLIDLEVDDVLDTIEITNLITDNSLLEFREMYTMRELAPVFSKADELLGNAIPPQVEAPVDTTTNSTPAMVKYSDLDPPSQENKPPSITTYLLFGQAYTENNNLRYTADIGRVLIKDTSAVNKMLTDPRLVNALPKDTRFLYDVLTDYASEEKRYCVLYAVRSYPGQPAVLDNDDIKEAIPLIGTDGRPEINLIFKPTGSKKWYRMTKDNVDKPIAIIVNNRVITAPHVNTPIDEGTTVISGGFTLGETQNICYQLNAGKMTAEVNIVKQEMTKKSSPLFPGNPIIYPIIFLVAGSIGYLLIKRPF